jgi:type II secretory pathway pseudopilin PulG
MVEMMIVVLIIGLLAGIAVPMISRSRKQAQETRFLSDMRSVVHAFEQYSMLHSSYPLDQGPGVSPPEILAFLPRFDWAAKTPIGGRWDWDNGVFGFKAGVSVYLPDRTDDEMAALDRKTDDGNLSSGIFQKRTDGFISIIEK